MVRIDKLLALVAFTFLICVLVMISITGPATGYEISIYSAYPPYFWFFLLSSLTLGIFILVRQAFSQKRNNWWLTGLGIVILSNAILLLLPYFRGYYALGFMDPMGLLGYIKDIQLTGHFGAAKQAGENFYPALHILVASISYFTGLEAELITKLIPAIFFTFYIVSMYLLSREMTKEPGSALLITAFSALPLYMSTANESMAYTIPRLETFFLIPFVLYLLFKSRTRGIMFATPFILMLLVLPTWHPGDGGPFLMSIFLTLRLSYLLYKWLTKHRAEEGLAVHRGLAIGVVNPALIILVAWFTWYSSFRMFEIGIESLGNWIIYGAYNPEIYRYLEIAERAAMTTGDILILTLKRHGAQIFFFLPSIVISVAVWRRLFFSWSRIDLNLVVFSFLFVGSAAVAVFSLIAGAAFGYTRFIMYVVFGAVLLNGLGLYLWLHKWKSKVATVTVIMLFLLLPLSLGTFNIYRSPFRVVSNDQVTLADMEGMKWFLSHRNEELLVEQVSLSQFSLGRALTGNKMIAKNLREWYEVEKTTPKHFGYHEHSTFGASYKDDRYFLSHTRSYVMYTEGAPEYPAAWRWTPEDFSLLENDSTVSRLYNNGGFEIFYVKGQQVIAEKK